MLVIDDARESKAANERWRLGGRAKAEAKACWRACWKRSECECLLAGHRTLAVYVAAGATRPEAEAIKQVGNRLRGLDHMRAECVDRGGDLIFHLPQSHRVQLLFNKKVCAVCSRGLG